jgi:nitrogen fixation NifU-like protein
MSESIYQEVILEHYRNPKNFGKLTNATKSTTVLNPLCGDAITMTVIFKGDVLKDIKFIGQGCAISQALTSQLTEHVKNKTKKQLRKLDRAFMIKLVGIELGPNRLKCALLPLEALKKLIV